MIKEKISIAQVLTYILLTVGGIIFLIPFYWMFRSSLMDQGQIFEMPPVWLPNPIRMENFKEALTIMPFNKFFLNTIIIVVLATAGVVLTSSITAFSFARMRWPGRDKVFICLLSGMMLPQYATLIPTFLGWKFLGAVGTNLPLIIPSWFGGGAFYIFLLRQFYMAIPKELDEAAYVDGAGYFRIFLQIILPLTKPAIVVVILFSFLHSWNDFLAPVIYLNDVSKYTLTLGLALFSGMYNAQWNLMMAASAVVAIPAIIVFLFGQKYFVEGISITGLKG